MAYPVASAERFPELPLALGGVGFLLLAAALLGAWPSVIPGSLVAPAAAYAAELALRDDGATVDAAAPLYGAGLLLLAELAYWSVELRGPQREERRLVLRRAGALTGLALGSIILGALVVTITAVPLGGGVVWNAVGVAAAAAALALIVRLVRRDLPDEAGG